MPVDYLISARRVRGGKFRPEPGKLRYLRVPRNAREPKPGHRARGRAEIERWVEEVRGIADGQPGPHSISECGDVLIFIHGYNNSSALALTRQRILAKNLQAEGWHGVVIGFDWPSDDKTLNYLEDRSDAAKVAGLLVEGGLSVLVAGQERDCRTNVHLLGHSTGAYVIREAFERAPQTGSFHHSNWRIGQVAFISADISKTSLDDDSRKSDDMFRRIMRLTNYSNPFDAVLGVSNAKRLGVSPRAGRHGLTRDKHDKAINVDCGDHFNSLRKPPNSSSVVFSHSWHFEDRTFIRDLAMTLEGAIDRHVIPTRDNDNGRLVLRDATRPEHIDDWDIAEIRR